MFLWAIMLGAVAMLGSCARPYRNVLFNTPRKYQKMGLAVVHLNPDTTPDATGYQHRIRPDDLISLRFLNDFDLAEGATIADGGAGNTGISFLVDKDGYASLPMLGKIYLEGHTKHSAQALLQQEYSKHFKSPNIEVSIMNLSVSVQGEVGSPGIYELRRERTSLLEVLAAAGGIGQFGKQSVVKVIRGTGLDREPEVFIFDLRQMEAVETSALILRDKDVIYVEPRDIQVIGSRITPYSTFLTLLSTVATITVVMINLTR